MTRIEISLDEYNELKKSISDKDNEIHKQEHIIIELEKMNLDLYSELYDIVNGAAIFDRLFNWNKTIKDAEMLLKEYKEKYKKI